ncbi:MAG: serine/threonine protein kinase, partial [Nannocystaceae bacterium]
MPRRPLRQSHRRGENSGEYDSEDLEDLEDTQRVSLPRMDAERDIGKVINKRYKINDRIGEGGMGVVYRAHDMQVDRAVAIKLVRRECLTDNKFLTRFRRELEVTSQFRHPSSIRVYEHGETRDGRPYMVMELLTGQSLADCLEDGR